MRLEAMEGWQYVESTIYDMGTSHAVHTMSSRSLSAVCHTSFRRPESAEF